MSAVAGLVGGGINLQVTIAGGSFSNDNSPASFELSSNGEQVVNGTSTGLWLISGLASQAECYAELVSGSVTSGIINNWVPLSTSRRWTSGSCTLNISIRQVGTSTTLYTDSVELIAFYGGGLA